MDTTVQQAMGKLDVVKDVLTVKRVFGEAYHEDGATVIPVAAVRGAGGGGGGEGSGPGGEGEGSGSGVGFGVHARPVGVVVVRDGEVRWVPTVDAMRIVVGAQIVAAIAVWTFGRVLRHRHHHVGPGLPPGRRHRGGPRR